MLSSTTQSSLIMNPLSHNVPHLITLLCLTPDTFTHQGESLRINELINSSYDYYYNYNSNNITKWKVKYPVN